MRRVNLINALLTLLLFILLETVSIVLVTKRGVVQRYRILGASRAMQAGIWESENNIRDFFSYRSENRRLVAENERLHDEIEALRSAWRDLPEVIGEGDYSYIGATVLKNSVNRQSNSLILNRGEQDGIEEGMGVVTDCGIVGIVDAVDISRCRVISFLSAGQSVSAKLTRENIFGTMSWPGRTPSKALLSQIPAHAEAAVGDSISSSGFSTIFPADIPLGVVSKVSSDGVSINLTIDLFQDFTALQHVYIVRNNRREEIRRLENEK